jgi:hypothetical protein
MINNIAELMEHLSYIGSKVVHQNIEVYLVGGAALMYHHVKESTHDVDLLCDYQETNTLTAALRPHGLMAYVKGLGGHDFLRFYLKKFVVEIFIRDMWVGDEYDMVRCSTYDKLLFGNVTFLVPDVKTVLKIKNNQTEVLLNGKRQEDEKD